MPSPLRALRHRNFAYFVAGQSCALIGYWIQQIAVAWLVYKLSGSATLLGVLSFAANLPILLLAPVAGIWADRYNRHRMMLATQVLEMLQAIALAVLAYGGWIEVWHVVVLTFLLGTCVAVELPVRHAYLLELIDDKQDLPNAVATTSLVANCGRLVGPSVAGLLIAYFSEATCFLINAISYVAVLVSFAFIRVTPQKTSTAQAPALRGIIEGAQYAWRTLPIRRLLTVLALVALTAAPYSTLMPAVVHEAFDGNAQTLGFLVGAAGCGAVIGTLLLASRGNVRGLLRFIVAAALLAGCALTALSQSRLLPLSLLLMALIGFSILVTSVSINMILQTIVDDDKRGRVMSLYTVSFLGVVPLGGLIAGALADHIGATRTLLVGGLVCMAGALYMLRQLPQLRKHMRETYARLGIESSS
jgi:MFS family permease